jgi:hypothetical protein
MRGVRSHSTGTLSTRGFGRCLRVYSESMRLSLLASLVLLLLPARLPAQAAPVLGRGSFSGLRARVTAIRFFESAGGALDPKSRVITTRFDALTTRFINLELELEYAKAAKRTPFQVECRFEGPGGAARALTLAGTIEAGWTGSYHTGGVGSAERGQWAEGLYKVSCREAGQLVAATQVEVVKATAAVRKLGAAVVQMKFFQSLGERMPVEIRRYSTRFDARTARLIKTEFALVYPQVAVPVGFNVECAYVFPDNSVKRVSVERQIPAGWTGSVHVQGIAAEHWPVGKYSVSCWNNGEKMAERRFEVFDSGAGSRESGGGKLRFFARHSDAAADTAAHTTFETGGYDTLLVEASAPQRVVGDSAAFACALTDPAGITSEFRLEGALEGKDKVLVARGPLSALEPPKFRGSYRVECRAGGRAVLADRFEVSGKPDIAELDARLVNVALFDGGDEPPGDEAVPDVAFSAAKLKSLWIVALLDHPAEKTAAPFAYSCKVTGARNAVVASSGPQTLSVGNRDRVIVLRQRLAPAPRQRWVPGKYGVTCGSGSGTFLSESLDLIR